MSLKYIHKLAEEFDLPVEKVALVWSTTSHVLADHMNRPSQEDMYEYVGDLLVQLFPK